MAKRDFPPDASSEPATDTSPTTADRTDLLLEYVGKLDSSGSYSSAWIDSTTVMMGSVLTNFVGGAAYVVVVESMDKTHCMPNAKGKSGVAIEVIPASRYFKVCVSKGTANAPLYMSVRS